MSSDGLSLIGRPFNDVWELSTEEHYWVALEAVPTRRRMGGAFLAGEPYDLVRCEVSGEQVESYHCFMQNGQGFFRAWRPLTEAEFEHVVRNPVIGQMAGDVQAAATDDDIQEEGVKL